MNIVEHPIELQRLIDQVQEPRAGAIATFLGTVRNHNQGLPVTQLDYHAYRSMAENELCLIVEELKTTYPGSKIACQHRIGRLNVGDVAVACAVSTPHRGEAFAACRALLDQLKSRLPIWKREHGPDGPYWIGWKDARCGTGCSDTPSTTQLTDDT